jgi:hypothetical protein
MLKKFQHPLPSFSEGFGVQLEALKGNSHPTTNSSRAHGAVRRRGTSKREQVQAQQVGSPTVNLGGLKST